LSIHEDRVANNVDAVKLLDIQHAACYNKHTCSFRQVDNNERLFYIGNVSSKGERMSKYIKVTLIYETGTRYTPPIAAAIRQEMEELGLEPNVITIKVLDTEDDDENADTV